MQRTSRVEQDSSAALFPSSPMRFYSTTVSGNSGFDLFCFNRFKKLWQLGFAGCCSRNATRLYLIICLNAISSGAILGLNVRIKCNM